MTEGIKPRHVYVDEMHTDPLSGALQMLRYQLYYDHARADIEIHLGGPVPPWACRRPLAGPRLPFEFITSRKISACAALTKRSLRIQIGRS